MKKILLLSVLFAFFGCTNSVKNQSIVLNNNLIKVDENHYETIIDGNKIILDSYIVPFQIPYYIVLKSEKLLTLSEAENIAIKYIKPRGCTSPLKRRTDLDKSNFDKTEWLIGVEC
nr:hypothetical protein [Campylobacter sp.]